MIARHVSDKQCRRLALVTVVLFGLLLAAHAHADAEKSIQFTSGLAGFRIADVSGATPILFAPDDADVVKISAGLFAADVRQVTGKKPLLLNEPPAKGVVILVGTLAGNPWIQQLAAQGKLATNDLAGQWETSRRFIVKNPFPGVPSALVIAGSDRRGAAYGLLELSEEMGVSPWVWWADVPPAKHAAVYYHGVAETQLGPPAVKYRGFFINDEDWGLNPWAKKTFDPQLGNIGPKTYAKVFELMLRLRLNYIWPAMHPCSLEFGSLPENVKLADQYAVVAGSSHCEQMLANNVHWNVKKQGPWDYRLNHDTIYKYWEDSVKARRSEEAIWTLGIRGIHDSAMNGAKTMADKIRLMSEAIADQRAMLDKYVTNKWGAVAQCFVPYKEVQPIYDAGLEVPPDVTLVWADDNYGFMRRFSSPTERQRPGGSGFYYHLSYLGWPHSYVWINTRAPAFMWEELHKAWDNDARTIWMVNVGDIKPMEIGIDYFARMAWNPEAFGPDSQPAFLRQFAAESFGAKTAGPVADFLAEFYRLGTIRRPGLMTREWATSIPEVEAAQLGRDYKKFLQRETALAAMIPAEAHDAYTEMVGFPARVVGESGLIFLADRNAQAGVDVAANEAEIKRLRDDLSRRAVAFNTQIAGGKWNHVILDAAAVETRNTWIGHMRWPWTEKAGKLTPSTAQALQLPPGQSWRAAATFSHQSADGPARWEVVNGLGRTAKAVALEPAGLSSAWKLGDPQAPALEYDFKSHGGDAVALIDFLPTFRLVPGMKLRVSVAVDDQPPVAVEVPGSDGTEDENGPVRKLAVQDNYVRVRVPLTGLKPGKHAFKISAVDPGPVVDQISLPE